MKKLSLQEKAEAYDKAKARMMKAFSDNRCSLYFVREIFSESEEDKDERIKKGIKSILKHYAESGEVNCPYPFVSIKEALTWLEKYGVQTSLQTNERAWLYLISDVLTWKDGIGQYLDDPRVQELAKKLQSEYAQKLYNPSVLPNSSNIRKKEPKSPFKREEVKEPTWKSIDAQITALQYAYRSLNPSLYDKSAWDNIKTLELMCRDLKKLRKE